VNSQLALPNIGWNFYATILNIKRTLAPLTIQFVVT
jgi:hypothetical protein